MAGGLLERVASVAGVVRDHADACQARRRLADEVVDALREAGLYRSLVPSGLGGSERPAAEVVAAVESVAVVDGSAGWCAAIGAGGNAFWGYLAPEDAKDVLRDPDATSCNMFGAMGHARPAGGGAHALTGRWPFASNSPHAQWASLGAFWWDEDGRMDPVPRVAFVPIADVTVEDTWRAPGLRGTGSHHVAVADARVLRGQSVAFVDPAQAAGPLWRLPLFCLLGPVLGVVPLGIARGALDLVGTLIREQVGATRGALADDPVGLADFARADAAVHAARAGLFDALDQAWSQAEAGGPVTKEVQARLMLAVGYGCEVAVTATETCHRLAGGAAAYEHHPVLRKLLDVQTARQHIQFGFGARPILAQALVGVDVFAPPFIV